MGTFSADESGEERASPTSELLVTGGEGEATSALGAAASVRTPLPRLSIREKVSLRSSRGLILSSDMHNPVAARRAALLLDPARETPPDELVYALDVPDRVCVPSLGVRAWTVGAAS